MMTSHVTKAKALPRDWLSPTTKDAVVVTDATTRYRLRSTQVAPRGSLLRVRVATRGPLYEVRSMGEVTDIFIHYTDVRSILMVLWCISKVLSGEPGAAAPPADMFSTGSLFFWMSFYPKELTVITATEPIAEIPVSEGKLKSC